MEGVAPIRKTSTLAIIQVAALLTLGTTFIACGARTAAVAPLTSSAASQPAATVSPSTEATAPTPMLAYVAVAASPNTIQPSPYDTPGSVVVIDTSTNAVVKTLYPDPDGHPGGVVVSPDGTRVYVANNRDFTTPTPGIPGCWSCVIVIDTATNTVVATISLAEEIFTVFISPDGTRVYATPTSSIAVIDTATNSVLSTLPLDSLGIPGDTSYLAAITPDGSRGYVLSDLYPNDVGLLTVIDTTTDAVLATVPLQGYPSGVAFSPDGKQAYITANSDSAGSTVSVLDASQYKVVATIPVVGIEATAPLVSPDGKRLYVGSLSREDFCGGSLPNSSACVSVIDTGTGTVAAHVPIPESAPAGLYWDPIPPADMAITPDGARVYATIPLFPGMVAVIDTATNQLVANIPAPFSPAGIAIAQIGGH